MKRQHALVAALTAAYAFYSAWPRGDSFIGWGDDPYIALWTFEIVWHRISQFGPLWFLHRAGWWAPIFGGYPLGLACSENEAWTALFFWPLRMASGNGAWALQAGALLLIAAAVVCTALWLRELGHGELASWGGLLVAGSGWLQSQRGHYQNLCIFLIPLAFLAVDRLRRQPGIPRALLAGASVGWIAGWNLHYMVFAGVATAWLVVRGVRRREIAFVHLAAFALAASAAIAPFAIRYLELERVLGAFRAAQSYGTAIGELFARKHARRLLPPHVEATVEAGGLGVVWVAACVVAAVRVRAARPWLIAAAIAYWVALGPNLGAWQVLSNLPVVRGMRAIGRAQLMVVLFTAPAVLSCLEMLPLRARRLVLALLVVELLPGEWAERVPVRPAWFGHSALNDLLAAGPPVLALPDPDGALMLALADREPRYFAGISSRTPPGQEVLIGSIAAGYPVPDLIVATGARRVLARTPEFASAIAAIPGASVVGRFDEGTVFDVPGLGEGSLLDRDTTARRSSAPWPTLELVAQRGGPLSLRRIDSCHFRQRLEFGPIALTHDLRLQGNEIRMLNPRPGDVIVHHESRLAVFRLPPFARPKERIDLTCAGDDRE